MRISHTDGSAPKLEHFETAARTSMVGPHIIVKVG